MNDELGAPLTGDGDWIATTGLLVISHVVAGDHGTGNGAYVLAIEQAPCR